MAPIINLKKKIFLKKAFGGNVVLDRRRTTKLSATYPYFKPFNIRRDDVGRIILSKSNYNILPRAARRALDKGYASFMFKGKRHQLDDYVFQKLSYLRTKRQISYMKHRKIGIFKNIEPSPDFKAAMSELSKDISFVDGKFVAKNIITIGQLNTQGLFRGAREIIERNIGTGAIRFLSRRQFDAMFNPFISIAKFNVAKKINHLQGLAEQETYQGKGIEQSLDNFSAGKIEALFEIELTKILAKSNIKFDL